MVYIAEFFSVLFCFVLLSLTVAVATHECVSFDVLNRIKTCQSFGPTCGKHEIKSANASESEKSEIIHSTHCT